MGLLRLEEVAAPAHEPVELREVKDYLLITWGEQDGELADQMRHARQWLEPRVGKALITQTLRATFSMDRTRRMPVGGLSGPVAPYGQELTFPLPRAVGITSISQVEIETDVATFASVPSSGYVVDTAIEPAQLWIRAATLSMWAPLAGLSTVIGADLPRFRVTYQCGYGAGALSVPRPYRTAIMNAVGYLREHKDESGHIPDELLAGLDFIPNGLY